MKPLGEYGLIWVFLLICTVFSFMMTGIIMKIAAYIPWIIFFIFQLCPDKWFMTELDGKR